ncbi:hypothetical protein KI688_011138 [Linnemannia hyalina]|uniref:HCP-like protein n=1 Tax=Linnemannia hyalina TaxID=64524 RepID=A0A9P7Y037_9FUNG|nr:hypothetical protein KI688_011138 [Linnemannia hyalina]
MAISGFIVRQERKRQQVQAVRAVSKGEAPSSIAPTQPEDIFYVDCHTDPETQKPVVLWNDVLQAFDNGCAITDFSARRNPVWGLENAAMDSYSHIDNPAFAPPLRRPQAMVDDQSPIHKNLPALPHSNHDAKPPLRAPQNTTTDVPIEKDLAQLSISASLGDTSAQVALGNMYTDGEGVLQDYQSAMDWYLKSAIKEIQLASAVGLSVSRSYSAVLEWFIKAADQGDPDAQYSVGAMYNVGKSDPQNFAKAMEWYRMAADKEDAGAQCKIGIMDIKGQGVTKSYSEARKYFQKATDQGHPDAQNWLKELSTIGSDKQIVSKTTKKKGVFSRLFK